MDDKKKYKLLLNSVNRIQLSINKLEREVNELNYMLNNNFLINNKCIDDNEIKNIKNEILYIKSDLKSNVIPSIRRKAY